MTQYVTETQVELLTGHKIRAIGLGIVNEQLADTIRLATEYPDYPFLQGAIWDFKGLTRGVTESDVGFNSFRFESDTDPVVTVVADITDAYLFEDVLIQ